MSRLVCVECGAALDGDSRFWCKKHYTVLWRGVLPISDEVREYVNESPAASRRRLDAMYKAIRAKLDKPISSASAVPQKSEQPK